MELRNSSMELDCSYQKLRYSSTKLRYSFKVLGSSSASVVEVSAGDLMSTPSMAERRAGALLAVDQFFPALRS